MVAASRRGRTTRAREATPETYLGAARAEGFLPAARGRDAATTRLRRRAARASSASADAGRSTTSRRPPGRDATLRARVTGQGRLPRAVRPGHGARDRRRQAREDRAGDDAEPLPPALAARRPARTTCSCASRPASRATRSRSGDPKGVDAGCRWAARPTPDGARAAEHGRHDLARHRDPRTGQALRRARRAGVDRPGGAARVRVRLPRTQRRRQDHAGAAAAGPRAADLGDDAAARPRPAGRPRRGAGAGRRDRRGAALPPAPDRAREPPRPRRGARRGAHGRVEAALERVGPRRRAPTTRSRPTRSACASASASRAACCATPSC